MTERSTDQDFASLWARYHSAVPPLGWLLREAEKSRWARFHSLPESKRYSETEAEMAVIVDRQNQIAEVILVSGQGCWLVCCVASGSAHSDHEWRKRYDDLIARYGMTYRMKFDEDGVSMDVLAARTTWQAEEFESALRDIANDNVRALWISENDGAVFAPYDGGVDCILPSEAAAASLKSKFRDWLSQYPGGY